MAVARFLSIMSLAAPAALWSAASAAADDPAAMPNAAPVPVDEAARTEPKLDRETRSSVLPMFTPVMVALDEGISTETHKVGERFTVTVVEDVAVDGIPVISKGARGFGEITFASGNGAFGKPGIIGLSLRSLDVDGRAIILDGRYREEGREQDASAAVAMYVAGPLSALVRGKDSAIEAGRVLKAKTGEDFTYSVQPPIEIILPDPEALAHAAAEPDGDLSSANAEHPALSQNN